MSNRSVVKPGDKLLTVPEVLERTGMRKTWLYGQFARFTATGGADGLPQVKLGTATRVPESALLKFLEVRVINKPLEVRK